MHELIFFLIGFLLGTLSGVVLMCLLQINHIHDTNIKRKDDANNEKND